jgi:hypothetical protein
MEHVVLVDASHKIVGTLAVAPTFAAVERTLLRRVCRLLLMYVLLTRPPLTPMVKVRVTVAGVVGVCEGVTDEVGVGEGVGPATQVPLYWA